ncbi:hypothetical protein [Hyphomicrobium sp.]|jgi:hypothetical protein|uniref:hypothetical protein n=1 Tax=Hyphomicrobium sp. TaxID=82 RepID=UPI002C69C499|nr:hypothetical protein [Hyphomicrobium sp.]HVZ05405.1 hypothetical protein [Hyphomicrobium sp.]
MNAPWTRRILLLLLAGIALAALLAVLVPHWAPQRSPAPETVAPQQERAANMEAPSLSCLFYDFTHSRLIVGFDFAVASSKDASLRFHERAEAHDGKQTTFDADHSPVWAYSRDDDGTPTITSPDGATRIVLYGLKPEAVGTVFIEAGVRSNEYKNLGGQCRQVNLGGGHKVLQDAVSGGRDEK